MRKGEQMPIGFDRGDLSGGGTDWGSPEPTQDLWDTIDPWRDEPVPAPETGYWAWVEIDASRLEPTVWTRWVTREDERVCPECGPLDGLAWAEGNRPTPPLHVNCRCARNYAFTEWRTRQMTRWELRWIR